MDILCVFNLVHLIPFMLMNGVGHLERERGGAANYLINYLPSARYSRNIREE